MSETFIGGLSVNPHLPFFLIINVFLCLCFYVPLFVSVCALMFMCVYVCVLVFAKVSVAFLFGVGRSGYRSQKTNTIRKIMGPQGAQNAALDKLM